MKKDHPNYTITVTGLCAKCSTQASLTVGPDSKLMCSACIRANWIDTAFNIQPAQPKSMAEVGRIAIAQWERAAIRRETR